MHLLWQAWLALVPNPPDGSPSLLWGLFVTAGDQPQPQHRHIRPPRSAVKQVSMAALGTTRMLQMTDSSGQFCRGCRLRVMLRPGRCTMVLAT